MVKLTKLHGTSFKPDYSCELLKNVGKLLGSTTFLEEFTWQIFSRAFFLTLVGYTCISN